jgi:hypothetical protein
MLAGSGNSYLKEIIKNQTPVEFKVIHYAKWILGLHF